MSQPYYCQMDDGMTLRIVSDCAANAVSRAIADYLGHRVVKCWAGAPNNLPSLNGRLHYDVPKHEPLTERPRFRPILAKHKHEQCELFDDTQVLRESEKALDRRDRDYGVLS